MKKRKFYHLTNDLPLTLALQDFSTIVSLLAKEPTPLGQLILGSLDIWGTVDRSKHGTGGVWHSTTNKFIKFAWQVAFPEEIQRHLEYQLKGNTNATNSNLKALSFVLAFLFLEANMSVAY